MLAWRPWSLSWELSASFWRKYGRWPFVRFPYLSCGYYPLCVSFHEKICSWRYLYVINLMSWNQESACVPLLSVWLYVHRLLCPNKCGIEESLLLLAHTRRPQIGFAACPWNWGRRHHAFARPCGHDPFLAFGPQCLPAQSGKPETLEIRYQARYKLCTSREGERHPRLEIKFELDREGRETGGWSGPKRHSMR